MVLKKKIEKVAQKPHIFKNYSGQNWDRHNIRDCKFQNLFAAAKLIKKFGGKCIRMSSGEKEPLSKSAPNNIIDYASKWQSDFMDIYLPAHCKFLTPTGFKCFTNF